MGWDEDRTRTQQWISELEQLLGRPDLEASPEARLAAFATAANAEALLLFADTLHHAMGTLRDDLIPQVRAILGDLRLSPLSDRLLVRVAGRSAGHSRSGSLSRPELPERCSALPPPYGTGDSVVFGRGVPRLGSDVIEPHVVKSRDVRPCLAVDSCMGRYVADAEFIGQLLIRQAVRPPCP